MTTLTIPVLATFQYKERLYHKGDVVTMTALDAVIHARKNHVTLSKSETYQRKDLQPETTEEAPKRSRRRYRRKDVIPEDSSE